MTIDASKIAKVKTAMDNRYENKQSNKKTSISGSYTGDNDSYPTVLACINKFGELITSWSVEPSDSKYPSEKLVKTALDNKISKSNTTGLVKNDGTIDTSTYLTQHQDISGKEDSNNKVTSWTSTTTDTHYPSEKLVKDSLDGKVNTSSIVDDLTSDDATKVLSAKQGKALLSVINTNASNVADTVMSAVYSNYAAKNHVHGNLTNDGKVGTASGKIITTTTDGAIQASDSITKSMISDFPSTMTPSSHTHGDLSNDGKLGTTANKPVITGTGGAITTGSFGTTANTFAEGNHTHSQYLTSHQSLSDIGGTVTVEKQTTAESGYIATYIIKQGGTALSPKINIPKDYLVKSASIGTVTTANNPVSGYAVGDKYLDFVINTKDSSGTDEHIYVNVKDLIDTYTAGSGLTLSNNEFSISNGDISLSMLASGVQTSLGYADTFHSSPAAGITSTQISDWNSMASGGMTQSNVDARINQALDDLAEAIYPTNNS